MFACSCDFSSFVVDWVFDVNRKILAAAQLRCGPERYVLGLLTPLLDGIKLFAKYDAAVNRLVTSLISVVGLMLILAVNYSGLSLAYGDSLLTPWP